jgi:hypothetical protein
MSKIVDMKIRVCELSDIFENNDVLYNVFLEFHEMNYNHTFSPYRPHPRVNFINGLTVMPSSSSEPEICMAGSITDTSERLDVTMVIFIPFKTATIDELLDNPDALDNSDIINKYLDIYKEQMCRYLLYENGCCLISSIGAIENFLGSDTPHTRKELAEYMVTIRDKYFKGEKI